MPRAWIGDLPQEILFQVLERLSPGDLVTLGRCCQHHRWACEEDAVCYAELLGATDLGASAAPPAAAAASPPSRRTAAGGFSELSSARRTCA